MLCIQVKQIFWSSRTVFSCGCICLNSVRLVNCLQCLFSDGAFLQSDECRSGGGGVLFALDDDKSLHSLNVCSHLCYYISRPCALNTELEARLMPPYAPQVTS